ncbi:MAG: acyltransferase family protein [Micropruina glycogenica]
MTETTETDRTDGVRRHGAFRGFFSLSRHGNPEAPGSGASRTEYREDIEGLRAVAVVGVILFHAGMSQVSGGFVGVDVFFVISGFLITGMLWRELSGTGKVGLRRFYGARARRLLPASALVGVVIAVGVAVMMPLIGPLQAKPIFLDGIASALYVGNYWFAQKGINYLNASTPPSPYEHYWSLGVEEQFYLVWPALMIGTAWLVRRAARRRGSEAPSTKNPYLVVLGVVAAASFVCSLILTRDVPPMAFFSLPTRAWELAIGGLVALTAELWRRLPAIAAAIIGWGGLALILVAYVELGRTTPYPGTAALLPVLGTALVIGAGCAAPPLGCGRILAVSPMRAAGRLSYSWYLWHWPVLMILLLIPIFWVHPLLLVLALLVISGILAWLTLRLIENPFRFAPRFRRSPGRSLALGGAVTAVAVCVCVAALVILPSPVGRGPAGTALAVALPPTRAGQTVEDYRAAVRDGFAQVQTAVAASADLKAVPSNLEPSLPNAGTEPAYMTGCLRDVLDVDPRECAFGDLNSRTTVALVGDSHAEMWTPAFRDIATQRGWRLETLAKGACPMLKLPIFEPTLRRPYRECDQWRPAIVARLKAEHPRLIVLAMSRLYGRSIDYNSAFNAFDSTWDTGITEMVRDLRSTGAAVLVLGPVPNPQGWVPNCLALHLSDATACSPARSKAVNQAGIAAEMAAAKAGGGQYSDITDLFCTPERCAAIVGDTLVYRDFSHVTVRYTLQLAPVIGALADLALAGG